jgi:hypothetical protein
MTQRRQPNLAVAVAVFVEGSKKKLAGWCWWQLQLMMKRPHEIHRQLCQRPLTACAWRVSAGHTFYDAWWTRTWLTLMTLEEQMRTMRMTKQLTSAQQHDQQRSAMTRNAVMT